MVPFGWVTNCAVRAHWKKNAMQKVGPVIGMTAFMGISPVLWRLCAVEKLSPQERRCSIGSSLGLQTGALLEQSPRHEEEDDYEDDDGDGGEYIHEYEDDEHDDDDETVECVENVDRQNPRYYIYIHTHHTYMHTQTHTYTHPSYPSRRVNVQHCARR